MLSDFLLGIFLSFFAVYGIVQTVINIFAYVGDWKVLKNKTVYTVVAVKNEEDKVEGIANALLLKAFKDDMGVGDNRVVIVDMGSTDKTKDILELLKTDKRGLNIFTQNDFITDLNKSI